MSAAALPAASQRGVSVILLRRGAVLMVQRANPPFAGLWSFPGGRIEAAETAETAARRELYEETRLLAGSLRSLGHFHPDAASRFELEVFAGYGASDEPRAGDDASDAEFVAFGLVLQRPHTPGAVPWVARAVVVLAGLDGA